MEQDRPNPFATNPEQVLKERMKHARKITREEFLKPSKKKQSPHETSSDKK
jgi:hypothetical protein